MSKLLEDMARAGHEAWKAHVREEGQAVPADVDEPFDGLSDYDKRHYRAEAGAELAVVLASLLEPSEGVINAGCERAYWQENCQTNSKAVWQAMLSQWEKEQGLTRR